MIDPGGRRGRFYRDRTRSAAWYSHPALDICDGEVREDSVWYHESRDEIGIDRGGCGPTGDTMQRLRIGQIGIIWLLLAGPLLAWPDENDVYILREPEHSMQEIERA